MKLFPQVYINSTGAFLPGKAVTNEELDRYIEPLNRYSKRIKARILKENGIQTRHYALNERGETMYSAAAMAGKAIEGCLQRAEINLNDIPLLCTGTSGGDTIIPGFANMVQGHLGAPPMETSSHQGVCTAGLAALKYAAMAVAAGHHPRALVAASEFPSRLFKKTRFSQSDYEKDFDSHFLRWMLSDGAGAMLLENQPNAQGISLRLQWVHLKSFSGDYPVCMQMGLPANGDPTSYLDYPSFSEAERQGAGLLRQDTRLLPQLFDLGIHEYAHLVETGAVKPSEIDHFLCHYSSEKFAPIVQELLEKAGLGIPTDRWYSNLKSRGNTGAASIFIMLDEFLRTRELKGGERLLCFVPESGRFTVGFMLFEVVSAPVKSAAAGHAEVLLPEPPQAVIANDHSPLGRTLLDLAGVWHDFRSQMFRTPFIQKIERRQVVREDYLHWMASWIPQVREGSRWMRQAAGNLGPPYELLRAMIEHHAGEEQFDFKILFDDYRAAGGPVPSLDLLRRNAGGEALNAFMYERAATRNAVDLLGAVYIIEGTGSRIIPNLLPLLRDQLPFSDGVYRFLRYHGANDENHLAEWRQTVQAVLQQAPDPAAVSRSIVETAEKTARLYLMQMEGVR